MNSFRNFKYKPEEKNNVNEIISNFKVDATLQSKIDSDIITANSKYRVKTTINKIINKYRATDKK